MRKFQWQLTFIERVSYTIDPFDREWFTPVTLPAECSISHFIIHFTHTDTKLFNFFYHYFDRITHYHAIDEIRILEYCILGRIRFFTIVMLTDNISDRNIEMLRKLMV